MLCKSDKPSIIIIINDSKPCSPFSFVLEFVCLLWSEVCSARVTSLLLLLFIYDSKSPKVNMPPLTDMGPHNKHDATNDKASKLSEEHLKNLTTELLYQSAKLVGCECQICSCVQVQAQPQGMYAVPDVVGVDVAQLRARCRELEGELEELRQRVAGRECGQQVCVCVCRGGGGGQEGEEERGHIID